MDNSWFKRKWMSAATPALISCSGHCSVNSVINGEISPTSPILKDVLVSLKDGLISFGRVCVWVCARAHPPLTLALCPLPSERRLQCFQSRTTRLKNSFFSETMTPLNSADALELPKVGIKGSVVPAWNPLCRISHSFHQCFHRTTIRATHLDDLKITCDWFYEEKN